MQLRLFWTREDLQNDLIRVLEDRNQELQLELDLQYKTNLDTRREAHTEFTELKLKIEELQALLGTFTPETHVAMPKVPDAKIIGLIIETINSALKDRKAIDPVQLYNAVIGKKDDKFVN